MTSNIVEIKPGNHAGLDFEQIISELREMVDRGELVSLAVCGKVRRDGEYGYYSDFTYPEGEWGNMVAASCNLHKRLLDT